MDIIEKELDFDFLIMVPVLILVGFGMVMIYSTSSLFASQQFGSEYFFIKRQFFSFLIGFLAMVFAMHFNYEKLKALSFPLLILTVLLLIVVLMPDVNKIRGAKRWLNIFGFSFQPSELAKLSLVIYLANSMSRRDDRIKKFKYGLLPYLTIAGIIILLIFLEPDFGGAVTMALIVFIMLFVGGVRVRYLLVAGAIAIPVSFYLIAIDEERWRRLVAFLNPWKHAKESGFQLVQSLIAFGSGKVFGVGLGESRQKLFYLPDAHADFIFSIIGEELGLVSVMVVIVLFVILVWRGLWTASRAPTKFGTYLALGLTCMIGVPALVNMSVVLGLVPTKGLVLPFLSYGGSSLIVNLIAIGIILNISGKRYRG